MKGKHEKKQFSALLALALCAVLVVTFMPNLMFRANAEDEKQEISGWKNLPSIEVKAGTTKEEVVNKLNKEYPQLKAEFLDSFGNVLEEKMVDVVWQDSKDYLPTAGTQAHFSATVKDTSKYTMSDTPSGTVRVVKEVESEAGTSTNTSSENIYGTRKSTVTQFTYPTNESLGSVGKYGVFARSYTQNGDMEGSVATESLTANANIGRSSSVKSYDPTESYD